MTPNSAMASRHWISVHSRALFALVLRKPATRSASVLNRKVGCTVYTELDWGTTAALTRASIACGVLATVGAASVSSGSLAVAGAVAELLGNLLIIALRIRSNMPSTPLIPELNVGTGRKSIDRGGADSLDTQTK